MVALHSRAWTLNTCHAASSTRMERSWSKADGGFSIIQHWNVELEEISSLEIQPKAKMASASLTKQANRA